MLFLFLLLLLFNFLSLIVTVHLFLGELRQKSLPDPFSDVLCGQQRSLDCEIFHTFGIALIVVVTALAPLLLLDNFHFRRRLGFERFHFSEAVTFIFVILISAFDFLVIFL